MDTRPSSMSNPSFVCLVPIEAATAADLTSAGVDDIQSWGVLNGFQRLFLQSYEDWKKKKEEEPPVAEGEEYKGPPDKEEFIKITLPPGTLEKELWPSKPTPKPEK